MRIARASVVTAAVLGAVVVPGLLAGCTSAEDTKREVSLFAERLEELSFVREATASTNEPLPFSFTTGVRVELEPGTDRADVDELHDLSCSIALTTSPSITLDYMFASGAVLSQERLAQCWDAPTMFVEALPALTVRESELVRVDWAEDDSDDGATREIALELTDAATVASSASIAGEVLAALADDGSILTLSSHGIDVPAAGLEEASTVVRVAADLAARYPIASVSLDDGLFVELASDVPGLTDEVSAYLAASWSAVPVRAVVDSTASVGGSTPDQALLDAGDTIRASGFAQSVAVGDVGIEVRSSDMASNVEIAKLLESRGIDDVFVRYSTQLPEGVRVSVTAGGTLPLTAAHLEDAALVAGALVPTGKIGSIDYEPGGLQVYLTEQLYDDQAANKEVAAIMRDIVASDRYVAPFRWVELNNRSVE